MAVADVRRDGRISTPMRIAIIAFLSTSCMFGQSPGAQEALQRALHLADLYNWAGALPDFTRAEELFTAAGDQRNALYARLGRIRAGIEQDRRPLPVVSAELADELADNPLLQTDKHLRMFALIVKGDIDNETDNAAMRRDWEEVQKLATELGDTKWQYRSLAQLGLAAFYDADLATARQNVGMALEAAMKAKDVGGQIRFQTMLGGGAVESKVYEQSLPLLDGAIALARTVPDAGYQFPAQALRTGALIGLKRFDEAETAGKEMLQEAAESGRSSHKVTALRLLATIAQARNEPQLALSYLTQAISLAESAGLLRALAYMQSLLADALHQRGDLAAAEGLAERAAEAMQRSGNLWAVPETLRVVADLKIAQGKYAEADEVFDRAEAFLDSMVGKSSTVLDKQALLRASSNIYAKHFSLVAEHLDDPAKAYAIVEQVRGRTLADLLASGAVSSPAAEQTERRIAQLRLKLMAARSNKEVRQLRDEIFKAEQSRWVAPGVTILNGQSHEPVPLERLQRSLGSSDVLLEYVLASPRSYCLVIDRERVRIVRLSGRPEIEDLIASYASAVRAKRSARLEARRLYDAVLRPVLAGRNFRTVVVVRDGQLHAVPFEALRAPSGRYLVQSTVVKYAPSATSFHLLAQRGREAVVPSARLLAVGGVPYESGSVNKTGIARGFERGKFVNLPLSKDEVRVAASFLRSPANKVLLGARATEAEFKRADLDSFRVIHLAVHGVANTVQPDQAALVLLSDPGAGEDGFLQASEVVQLGLNADLVVLSACDTAVGALQGQEGIANLSRSFLLAGARNVVSALWPVSDDSSLFLMRRFFKQIAAGKPAAVALAQAKREYIQLFGRTAVPYHWAAFTIEGGRTSIPSAPVRSRSAQ